MKMKYQILFLFLLVFLVDLAEAEDSSESSSSEEDGTMFQSSESSTSEATGTYPCTSDGKKNRDVGERCDPDVCEPCEDEHAVCDKLQPCVDKVGDPRYVCQCELGYQYGNNETCMECVPNDGIIGQACPFDDWCVGLNTVCVNDKCVCEDGLLYADDGNCYGTQYNESCSVNYCTCDCTKNLICNGTDCVCYPDHYVYNAIEDKCYGDLLHDNCYLSCFEDFVDCINGTCQCIDPFSELEGSCVGSDYLDPCIPSKDTCDCDLSLKCIVNDFGEAVCNCTQDFNWSDTLDTCVGFDLGDVCDPEDVCTDVNGMCSNGVWVCDSPLFKVENECVGTDYLDPCIPSKNTCDCALSLKCIVTESEATCNCTQDLFWSDEVCTCVGFDLGDACDLWDDCTDVNGVCLNGVWACNSSFIEIDGKCVGTSYLDPCILSTDTCDSDLSLKCDVDEFGEAFCNCSGDLFWSDAIATCVGVGLGQVCDPNVPCKDYVAGCFSTCVCPAPYVEVNGVCTIITAGSPINGNCGGSISCTDPHSVCENNKCVCDGYTEWDFISQQCVIIIGAKCDTTSDTCADGNASCISDGCDYTCQCDPGYFNDYDDVSCSGECVPQVPLYGDCYDVEGICTPVENTTCVNGKCACKEGYSDMYGVCQRIEKQLGDNCICSDTCLPDGSAFCNATNDPPVCDCKPGYYVVDDGYQWFTCQAGLYGSCHDSTDCAIQPLLKCYNIPKTHGKHRWCTCNEEGNNGVILNAAGTDCVCKDPTAVNCHVATSNVYYESITEYLHANPTVVPYR